MEQVPCAALRRNPGIEETGLQDELMLFDPATGRFYVLNSTMAFAWKHIGSASTDEIAAALEAEFSVVDSAQAKADIVSAIDELVALGLVQPA